MPVAKSVPPLAASYQSIFAPALAVAVSVDVPLPQMAEPFDEDKTVGLVLFIAATGYFAGSKPKSQVPHQLPCTPVVPRPMN